MGLFRRKSASQDSVLDSIAKKKQIINTYTADAPVVSEPETVDVRQLYDDGIAAYRQWTNNPADLQMARKAYDLLNKAEQMGYEEKPLPELAYLLVSGTEGIPQDMQRSKNLLLIAVTAGSIWSMNNLAHIYELEKEYKKAFYWYSRAAEKGYSPSIWTLAKCYWKGILGLAADPDKAREWAGKLPDNYVFSAADAELYDEICNDIEPDTDEDDGLEDGTEDSEECPLILQLVKNTLSADAAGRYEEALGWLMQVIANGGLSTGEVGGDLTLVLCHILYNWATHQDYPGFEKIELDMAGIVCYETLRTLYDSDLLSGMKYKEEVPYAIGDCLAIGYGTAENENKAWEWYGKAKKMGLDVNNRTIWK